MRGEKHQQILEAQTLTNIESRLLPDFVAGESAIAKAEDPESLVWVIFDLVIDFPKLALTSLLTSVRCWLRESKDNNRLSNELRGKPR